MLSRRLVVTALRGAAARPLCTAQPSTGRDRVDPDTERVRFVERRRLALALDRELRSACRADATARRTIGVVARELLRRRAYQRLGFARLADYARERLGISARTVESAAWVATRLDDLPLIAAAFADGALSWTQARLLCGVARPDDEATWLARARGTTVDELEALIEAAHAPTGAAASDDPDDDRTIEGEPVVRLRLACPARVRALWRHALELARRVAGEPLPTWRAVEYIAAEGIAGRRDGTPVGDRALLAMVRLARRVRRAAARVRGASKAGDARVRCASAAAPGDVSVRRASDAAPGDAWPEGIDEPSAHPTALSSWPDAPSDVHGGPPELAARFGVMGVLASAVVAEEPFAEAAEFALDAKLRGAVGAIGRVEPRIGRLLRMLVDHRLYRALGFSSSEGYVRERLGISLRKAWALLKIEKTVRRSAPFAEAYEQGRLSWVRALTLVPVVDRHNAGEWIARANTVTVRRLTDEVNWVLDARDVGGPDVALVPPPLDSPLIPHARAWHAAPKDARAGYAVVSDDAAPRSEVECQETSLGVRLQIGAHAAEPAGMGTECQRGPAGRGGRRGDPLQRSGIRCRIVPGCPRRIRAEWRAALDGS